jgi:hypothetical protein
MGRQPARLAGRCRDRAGIGDEGQGPARVSSSADRISLAILVAGLDVVRGARQRGHLAFPRCLRPALLRGKFGVRCTCLGPMLPRTLAQKDAR